MIMIFLLYAITICKQTLSNHFSWSCYSLPSRTIIDVHVLFQVKENMMIDALLKLPRYDLEDTHSLHHVILSIRTS